MAKKASVLVGALALAGAAAGHPLQSRNHRLVKRDDVTNVVYTTVVMPEVVVWVDGSGSAYSTEMVTPSPVLSMSAISIQAMPLVSVSPADASATTTMPRESMGSVTAGATSTLSLNPTDSVTSTMSLKPTVSFTSTMSLEPTGGSGISTISLKPADGPSTSTITVSPSPVASSTSTTSLNGSASSTSTISLNASASSTSTISLNASASSTSTLSLQAPASSTSTISLTPLVSTISLQPTGSATAAINEQAPSTAAASSGKATAQASNSNSKGNGIGMGVAYDAYTASGCGSSPSPCCKSEDEIASEFAAMSKFDVVRIYGSDCDLPALALQHAVAQHQRIIFGIYIPDEDIDEAVQGFADAVRGATASGSWDPVALVTVENEQVNNHILTADEVVDAISQTRSSLARVGYHGPVGAVDTVPATVGNPSICAASDYALVNCHAFFDTNTAASDAGSFVKSQVQQVEQACPGKTVVVTESGWPYQGDANGHAVPTKDNQAAAMASLKDTFGGNMILFSPFDSDWKSDFPGSFGAEKYWGFLAE